jgi:poly(3-hydroxyalkanoate) synthetase
MLVIATGKNKKVSKSQQSETVTLFESFLMSYIYTDTLDNTKLMVSSGQEHLFTKEDILYECGTRKGTEKLVDNLNKVVSENNEQYFEIGSIVYYVSNMKEISAYEVKRYKYEVKEEQTDLYLINPIDNSDYIIVCESEWRNPMRVNKSINNLKKLWTNTK